MLILHDLTPWHWALGGLAIALITLSIQYVGNRSLGISTGLEDACALGGSRLPYFQRSSLRNGTSWRMPFFGGLLTAGLLSAVLAGGWAPTWNLGMLDTAAGLGEGGKVIWMLAGGLLIGFGTRLASGCTSGHGIFGLSNLQPASWLAVVAFMLGGIVTSNLVFRVLF